MELQLPGPVIIAGGAGFGELFRGKLGVKVLGAGLGAVHKDFALFVDAKVKMLAQAVFQPEGGGAFAPCLQAKELAGQLPGAAGRRLEGLGGGDGRQP